MPNAIWRATWLVFDRRTTPLTPLLALCDLGALAVKKEGAAHLEPVAAFERIAARFL
jgi:hypothetical protein